MFKLEDIPSIVGGNITKQAKGEIPFVSTDTRTIRPRELFVPLIGEFFDGHDYLAQAEEKGAAAALWSRDTLPDTKLPLILVEDTLLAYQKLAGDYAKRVDPFVIAITGSNGKTTTKDLTYAILKKHRKTHGTKENLNNEIGVPHTLLTMPEDTEVLVLEIGIERAGEMEPNMDMISPDIAVFTNIGEVHREYFRSLEEIAESKMKMIDGMKEEGIILLNGDDPYLMRELERKAPNQRIEYFGKYREGAMVLSENPLCFVLDGYTYRPFLLGHHQFYNISAACIIGSMFGLAPEKMEKNMEDTRFSPKRVQIKENEKIRIMDDSYKSNPESLLASMDTYYRMPGEHRLFLLGDMMGLALENEKELHRKMGRELIRRGTPYVIAYGDLAKYYIDEYPENRCEFIPEGDIEAVLEAVQRQSRPGTFLFVKGSSPLKMGDIVEQILKL